MPNTAGTRGARRWGAVVGGLLLCLAATGFSRGAAGEAAAPAPAGAARWRIACTTFPMWIIARNVVAGIEAFEANLVMPPAAGCPHDYEPSLQDINRVAAADALVINGLGLDDRFVAVARRDRKDFPVIDASRREHPRWIKNGDPGDHDDHDEHAGHDDHDDHGHAEPAGHGDHNGRAGHGHDHGEWNAHYFTSPAEAALAARAIAKGLRDAFGASLAPAQSQALADNAARYGRELDGLADSLRQGLAKLPNRRIIVFHDAMAYFARDFGLTIDGIIETHPGVEPSPAEVKRLITRGAERKVGGVFSEPAYDSGMADIVAAGLGLRPGELDPVASGPADAPPDYYQRAMRANLAALEKALAAAP